MGHLLLGTIIIMGNFAYAAKGQFSSGLPPAIHVQIVGEIGSDHRDGIKRWANNCQAWINASKKKYGNELVFIMCGTPHCQDSKTSSVCQADAQLVLKPKKTAGDKK